MIIINKELGSVAYSQEVIGKIVGLSTMECYGVVGMASKNTKDGIWQLLKGENLSKGVKFEVYEGKLNIELFVVILYGTKVSEIANNIIQKIKYNVQNFTGLKVASITVNVQGVRI